ncbi:MAG: spore coat associated protein CotJA [Ruminococcus sp.]|nr:spore coat associated protein CotJA [Ruminococcus sp.]MCD7801214.1 spore coat associated protein CotJA [Ruminococcus sp.]
MEHQNLNQETKIPTTRLPKDIPLASAFTPYQMWEEPMSPEDSLKRGTMFTELDLPFLCEGGMDYER